MSDEIIIRVEKLGKRYRIQHHAERQRYVALRDVIAQKMKAPFQFLRRSKIADGSSAPSPISHLPTSTTSRTEDFWALRDVSFEVKRGEVVGIIGRNGAGKSTLLKILSRITEPTEGRVRIKGRVASLLEVGTGFHPELTGRENIFLNGAILGMHRAEIKQKFEEIVAFAEVEKFLDTPVKRYSSGMYVRLAFAVAAHLEPEILIVDEVLAVGDAEFQKKCLGKIESVSREEGRTVLFVSHNMAAIEHLCESALLLSQGRLVEVGKTANVVRNYLQVSRSLSGIKLNKRIDRQGSGKIRFESVELCDKHGLALNSLTCGASGVLIITFRNEDGNELRNLQVSVGIDNDIGQRVLLLDSLIAHDDFARVSADVTKLCVEVPKVPLLPGHYEMTLFSSVNGTIADWIRNAASFDVVGGDFFGTGRLPPAGQGFFAAEHSFRLLPARDSEET